MIKNYLKIAIRNLQKQRVITFINVFGLSTGIACFSLLLLFVLNEFSFDKFNKNAPDIYRVYALWDQSLFNDRKNPQPPIAYTDYESLTPKTLGEAMKEDLPDIVNYVRLQLPWGENLVQTDHKTLRAQVGFADPSFFFVFNFPLKYGNKETALHNMNDIVLTESRAKQLFGSDNVVGKTVEIQLGTTIQPFRISAIAENIPSNSTIRFDVLGNFVFIKNFGEHNLTIGNNWHPQVWQTYVQLRSGSKLPNDVGQMERFIRTFTPNVINDAKSSGWKGNKLPVMLKLQPMLHIHTD